jgi:hypothetical protein
LEDVVTIGVDMSSTRALVFVRLLEDWELEFLFNVGVEYLWWKVIRGFAAT